MEVPTPTANFKSYRRVVGGTGSGEGEEGGRLSHSKGPAPLLPTTKLKSVTRLSFDQQPPYKVEEGGPVRISVKAPDYKKPTRRQQSTADRQQSQS